MTLDADELRSIERNRLRSLVDADLDVAEPLHAPTYQLVTPRGVALSKVEYLGLIGSGELNYRTFEPVGDIEVWGDDQIALLRYVARIAFHAPGPETPIKCWHTDSYARLDGRWQAVWSQATLIAPD